MMCFPDFVAAGTVFESVHIPVVLTETGLKDTVYNDFYIVYALGLFIRIYQLS